MKLHLPARSEAQGRAFFAALSDAPVTCAPATAPEGTTRDPALLLGAAGLILSLPAAYLAVADIKARWTRPTLTRALKTLKAELQKADAEAVIETASGDLIDLRTTSPDKAADRILGAG